MQPICANPFKIRVNPLCHIFLQQPRGYRNCICNASSTGPAMTLDHNSVESKENRTIVIIGIKVVAQQIGCRPGNQEAKF